jgi:hypothetical protein
MDRPTLSREDLAAQAREEPVALAWVRAMKAWAVGIVPELVTADSSDEEMPDLEGWDQVCPCLPAKFLIARCDQCALLCLPSLCLSFSARKATHSTGTPNPQP